MKKMILIISLILILTATTPVFAIEKTNGDTLLGNITEQQTAVEEVIKRIDYLKFDDIYNMLNRLGNSFRIITSKDSDIDFYGEKVDIVTFGIIDMKTKKSIEFMPMFDMISRDGEEFKIEPYENIAIKINEVWYFPTNTILKHFQ